MSVVQSPAGIQVAQFCPISPARIPSMQPATIICDKHQGDGTPCGETALIQGVHYVYSRNHETGSQAASHMLREAHFVIDCPRCGRRTQIEKYE
jgi:hypothetical protein